MAAFGPVVCKKETVKMAREVIYLARHFFRVVAMDGSIRAATLFHNMLEPEGMCCIGPKFIRREILSARNSFGPLRFESGTRLKRFGPK